MEKGGTRGTGGAAGKRDSNKLTPKIAATGDPENKKGDCTCWYCGKADHLKKNCPKLKADKATKKKAEEAGSETGSAIDALNFAEFELDDKIDMLCVGEESGGE